MRRLVIAFSAVAVLAGRAAFAVSDGQYLPANQDCTGNADSSKADNRTEAGCHNMIMFVADGTNNLVWILDRKSGKTLGSFGGNGKYAGQFHWVNAIGTDTQGNIYTGEVEQAKRIQKFAPVAANGRR